MNYAREVYKVVANKNNHIVIDAGYDATNYPMYIEYSGNVYKYKKGCPRHTTEHLHVIGTFDLSNERTDYGIYERLEHD